MIPLILIAIQVVWNLINSRIDAYIFLKNKTVAHGINGGLYITLIAAEIWYLQPLWWMGVIFAIAALFNRQVTFDIPLNLRRRKTDKTITWDYISRAKNPKAIIDRIERKLFGYDGRLLHIAYILLWITTTGLLFYINSLHL